MEEFAMRHIVDEEKREKLRFTPQQKEFIFREISYRVRENLNTIASIFGLQQLQAEAKNDLSQVRLMRNSKFRINTFSLLQELYYPQICGRKPYEEYLCEILEIVENATGVCAVADVDVGDLHLTQRQKVLIGTIVAELYAHTLEYICRRRAEGRCRVEISVAEEGERHIFHYREHAVSEPQGDLHPLAGEGTIGLKLVALHVRELHGEMQRLSEGEGSTTVRITF